ncbi:tRNA 5-(aminomethyl)-2-thiouridylate-methyltransferase MnmM [Virgibacillus kimchii]
MTLKGILKYAHYLLEETVEKGDTVIDATCGNGHDTVFLSRLVGEEGHVLAIDIQEQAIQSTKDRLVENRLKNVSLIHDSHAYIGDYLQLEDEAKLGGAIFNLGYLPRSDKKVITESDSTITAVSSILYHLKQNRLVVIVVYHGHEGGEAEKKALLKYVTTLDQKKFAVLKYGFINQKNDPPFILAVQKK